MLSLTRKKRASSLFIHYAFHVNFRDVINLLSYLSFLAMSRVSKGLTSSPKLNKIPILHPKNLKKL